MKCRVYRSLDKSQSLFGLKGRFITRFGIIMGGVLFLAIVLGSIFGSFMAFVSILVGAVLDYLYIISIQGKSSERDFFLRGSAKKLPHFYYTPPGPLNQAWKGEINICNIKTD